MTHFFCFFVFFVFVCVFFLMDEIVLGNLPDDKRMRRIPQVV